MQHNADNTHHNNNTYNPSLYCSCSDISMFNLIRKHISNGLDDQSIFRVCSVVDRFLPSIWRCTSFFIKKIRIPTKRVVSSFYIIVIHPTILASIMWIV